MGWERVVGVECRDDGLLAGARLELWQRRRSGRARLLRKITLASLSRPLRRRRARPSTTGLIQQQQLAHGPARRCWITTRSALAISSASPPDSDLSPSISTPTHALTVFIAAQLHQP
ncbi:hypothetical protein SVAN01_09592 [Stagonosporopsis vannaccii]|nr:hypothetical protein SVAN01_09592 [Stagonosporopsis vannaccii]